MRTLPTALLVFSVGCQPTQPLAEWCADPLFDAHDISASSACPEHIAGVPEASKVGECGRFDVAGWIEPEFARIAFFQVRPDGSLVGVDAEQEYGRPSCAFLEWDCAEYEYLAVINVNEAPPACMNEVD